MRYTKRQQRKMAKGLARAIAEKRGEYLCILRERARMTRVELAERMDISVAMISQIESGARGLPADKHNLMRRILADGIARAEKEFLALRLEMGDFMIEASSKCLPAMVGTGSERLQLQA